ncbi:MAG: two-component system response regulator [Acidobacteria bacterium]|nr:MAG: two-component system response regulator [Acidobacteriota bacterium]
MLLETIHSALRGQLGVKKNLISLVDDDESIRRTTTLLIESFGFRATAFESAQSFLKSGQLHETSCLIIDVQMPGMNGLQLQSHLAAAGYNIPIIFITAHDNKESRQQALQAGAVAFLGKPFSDELLLQIIRAALPQDDGTAMTK